MAKTKKEQSEGKQTKATKVKKTGGKVSAGKKSKKKVEPQLVPKDYVPRLLKLYNEQITVALQKKFSIKNVNLIPKLDKIVLNVGIGTMHSDAKLAESVAAELELISGQKPVFRKAKRSISNFKLRQGMVVGCMVTLRWKRMYEFFDRLITYVIPRVRDFRGLSDRSLDGRGNYSFGVKEQIIFPEIDYDKVVNIHGMDITITTTARNDEEAIELLKGFGFPFRQHPVETTKDAA